VIVTLAIAVSLLRSTSAEPEAEVLEESEAVA